MNWYIGQEIICINDKNTDGIKEGIIYKIRALRIACCCVVIDVGNICEGINFYMDCVFCGSHTDIGRDNTHWYSESRFVPLADISELEELLKQQKETV